MNGYRVVFYAFLGTHWLANYEFQFLYYVISGSLFGDSVHEVMKNDLVDGVKL